MELTSEQILPVDQATAWAALNDIDLLKQSIPGCESLESTGPDAFELVILAAVGPVKARFKGRMQIEDARPPEAYTIRFDGQGGAAGFGKGSANVELVPEGPLTLLRYTATAQVGGKIAQIGSRLVDMAARKMAGQFFDKFGEVLAQRHPEQAAAAAEALERRAAAQAEAEAGEKAEAGSALSKVRDWFKRSDSDKA